MKITVAALACAAISAGAHAQNATPVATPAVAIVPAAPANVIMPVAASTQAVLRAGTPIALRLSEQLTTRNKKSVVGSRFQMEVADPVLVDGQVVIPAGSPATGEVTAAKGSGMWGKSGKMTARLLYVRANGRQIRLSGSFDDKGKSGTVGVVASVAFIPVAGFFVKGKNADIPMGAPVGGFIDEDVPLSFAAAAPAPMVIAAPAPMAVAAAAPASVTASTAAPAAASAAVAPAAGTPVVAATAAPAVVFAPASPLVAEPVPAAEAVQPAAQASKKRRR